MTCYTIYFIQFGYLQACAHRFQKVGASSRLGLGICVTMTNELDEGTYLDPCAAKPTARGHGQYGFCQAGTSADMGPVSKAFTKLSHAAFLPW